MLTRAVELEYAEQGVRIFGFSPGTIDTEMQVKIRASGINQISQIPRENLSSVADAARGLVQLCNAENDDLIGQDVSMTDANFRSRLNLT
jgi:NAD(P)-dependent dehydrogenase (short-subunit alcohol dehydrogenase family)